MIGLSNDSVCVDIGSAELSNFGIFQVRSFLILNNAVKMSSPSEATCA